MKSDADLPAKSRASLPYKPSVQRSIREPQMGPLVPLEELITRIEEPVENLYIEKLRRLLPESLNSSWSGPGPGRPFLITSDVGLFPESRQTTLPPDIMLGVDIPPRRNIRELENRSWFVWIIGKVPDLIIEFVSDRRGGEETYKLKTYARLEVPYYVIYDPKNVLKHGILRSFALREGTYELLDKPWFPGINLGLLFWKGVYEDIEEEWLRWCDKKGAVIPTGAEQAELERKHAAQERKRAAQERKRTAQERKRTAQERKRREELEAKLRAMGIDPSV